MAMRQERAEAVGQMSGPERLERERQHEREAEAQELMLAREREYQRIARGGLPERVKIGPYHYEVQIEDTPFVADDGQSVLCGEARHNDGRIRVLRGSPDRMFVTFWHEILHGCDDMAGTELTEDQVNRLAPVIAGVLLDNGFVEREGLG